jgi:hypothetical protein
MGFSQWSSYTGNRRELTIIIQSGFYFKCKNPVIYIFEKVITLKALCLTKLVCSSILVTDIL